MMTSQPYEQKLGEAIDALIAARDCIRDEIASYPTPISGCDQQYMRLMSDRTRITQAIQSLDRRPFVASPRVLEDTTA